MVALKGLRKTVEAYFIKWTISIEPPVGFEKSAGLKMRSQLNHTLFH